MKRKRTTRQFLGLESLETRQLLAGVTTSLLAPTRLPAPTTAPVIVAKPVATTSLAKPVVNTTSLQTSNLLGTPLTTQDPDLGAREPQTPAQPIAVKDPVSGSQLDKLPSDPTSQLDKEFAPEDENLLLLDVDAIFGAAGRTGPDVMTTVAASITDSAYEPDARGDTSGISDGQAIAPGHSHSPVVIVYEEGTGITKVNGQTNTDQNSTFKQDVLDFIGWKGDSETVTSETHKQIEEEEKQGGGTGDGNSGNGSTSSGGSTAGSGGEATGNGSSEGNTAEENGPIHYTSEDGKHSVTYWPDGTVLVMNHETGSQTWKSPEGNITDIDKDGNVTYTPKPSTPADDNPPLEDWIQKQVDQALAELRAAQNYQSSGGDIDWGDFDTAGGYLVASGATIDSLILQLCGEDIRPNSTDQGDFQQPEEGDVDPNPNDGN